MSKTDGYITVSKAGFGEYEEKHSRFLAAALPCESEEAANRIIAEYKKKYFDARHNVYAYVLKDKTSRFSDDGEPHGTAAKPVLDLILSGGITDVIIIVTRYFGGTLLGTGGLVRAYTQSAKEALENAVLCEMSPCVCLKTVCGYSDYNLLISMLSKYGCEITNTVFGHETEVYYSIKSKLLSEFETALSEKFAGKLECEHISDNFLKKDLKK